MPRGNPVVLATRSFANRKDATAFFRTMLNRYRPKQRVSDADAADLAALLTRHSEYEEKVGVGIDHFEVMSAEFGTQLSAVRAFETAGGFRVGRISGSS
jgi:hypothetical protein